MLLHKYTEKEKKTSNTVCWISHLRNARYVIFPSWQRDRGKFDFKEKGNPTLRVKSIWSSLPTKKFGSHNLWKLPSGLRRAQLPPVFIASNNKRTYWSETHASSRRCSYNRAKRAEDRTHSIFHFYEFSFQGRSINIFRLMSKRMPKKFIFLQFLPARSAVSRSFVFSQNLQPLLRVILTAQRSPNCIISYYGRSDWLKSVLYQRKGAQ